MQTPVVVTSLVWVQASPFEVAEDPGDPRVVDQLVGDGGEALAGPGLFDC